MTICDMFALYFKLHIFLMANFRLNTVLIEENVTT